MQHKKSIKTLMNILISRNESFPSKTRMMSKLNLVSNIHIKGSASVRAILYEFLTNS